MNFSKNNEILKNNEFPKNSQKDSQNNEILGFEKILKKLFNFFLL